MKYYDRWLALTRREHVILISGALFSIILLGYLGLWQPLKTHIDAKRDELANMGNLLVWMQNAESKIKQARPSQSLITQDANLPLALLIEQALQTNIELKQHADLKQLTQAKMQLSFNEISFDALASWLRNMQLHYATTITDFKAQALNKPGWVKAELILSQSQ